MFPVMSHDPMPVFEIRVEEALLAVSMRDRHCRVAPIWLLGIVSVAFRPLEKFCNSPSRHLWLTNLGWETVVFTEG